MQTWFMSHSDKSLGELERIESNDGSIWVVLLCYSEDSEAAQKVACAMMDHDILMLQSGISLATEPIHQLRPFARKRYCSYWNNKL